MRLTNGERLIAVMLSEVMENMGLNQEIDPSLVKRLVFNNDDWALAWQYPGLFEGEAPQENVIKETCEILAMWSFIEVSIRELKGDDAKEAARLPQSRFVGFDGNHDPHHGVAHTLIHVLGRWSEFENRALNSHTQSTLPRYRAMLPKYNAAMQGWIDGPLSLEALRDILS